MHRGNIYVSFNLKLRKQDVEEVSCCSAGRILLDCSGKGELAVVQQELVLQLLQVSDSQKGNEPATDSEIGQHQSGATHSNACGIEDDPSTPWLLLLFPVL
jgi:hypothetical protein